MKMFKVITAAAFALTIASASLAAQSQTSPTPSQVTETFGAWTVRCVGVQQKTCEAVQVINGQSGTIAEIAIALPTGQAEAIIASRAPLGVMLSEPILFGENDGADPIEINYVTCVSQGCLAQANVSAEGLLQLAGKKEGNLTFKDRSGRRYRITVSFDGLSDALTRLGAL
ncbi:MAG: invasion associated locus B family protein [Hoeflea sp.]|uniref:invasion associated locus B family protein n=1 Tax=Hoeflea sp. TaxID=1940281 RepID=UPI003EFA6803